MKAPRYREAIKWIVLCEDTEWLLDERPTPSITAHLVADLFGVPIEKVVADLIERRKKENI